MKQRVDEPDVPSTALEKMIDFQSLKEATFAADAQIGYDSYNEAVKNLKEKHRQQFDCKSKLDTGLRTSMFQRLVKDLAAREHLVD